MEFNLLTVLSIIEKMDMTVFEDGMLNLCGRKNNLIFKRKYTQKLKFKLWIFLSDITEFGHELES